MGALMSLSYGDFLKLCELAGIEPGGGTSVPGSAPAEKLRLIGTPNLPYSAGLRRPDGGNYTNNANTRFPHFVRSGANEVRLVYIGYFNNNAGEQPLENPVRFRASIEMPVGTFVGQVSGPNGFDMVLNPGQVLITDPIPLDMHGNVPLIRHFLTVDAGGSYPNSNMFNASLWPGSAVQTTSAEDGTTRDAIFNFPYNADAWEFSFTHNAVIGVQTKRTLAVLTDGDSIMQGTGTNGYLGRGWVMGILDADYCMANLGFPSNTARNASESGGSLCRMLYANWADAVIENFGTNDLAGNVTHALVASQRIERWSMWARRGLKVAACTVFPRVGAIDFTSEANQTPLPNWLAGGATQQHNAWIRDGAPATGDLESGFVAAATGSHAAGVLRAGETGHVLGAVFDQAQYVQGVKVGTWKVIAGDQTTAEGIHVSDAGAAILLASPVAAQMKAWCESIELS